MKKIIIFLLLANINIILNGNSNLSEINNIYVKTYFKLLNQINNIVNQMQKQQINDLIIDINTLPNKIIKPINKLINIKRPLTRYFIKQYLENLKWIPYFYLDASKTDESSTNLMCKMENKETKKTITITFKNFSNLINQQNIINYEKTKGNTLYDNYNNTEKELDELPEIYIPKKNPNICKKATILVTSVLAIAILLPESILHPTNFSDLLQN